MNNWPDSVAPRVSQDPEDQAFSANPYPFYRRIRAQGDFVFWEDLGLTVATTHVAATLVLRHPKLGRRVPADRRETLPPGLESLQALEKHSLPEFEPSEHARLRRISMQGFGRDRLARLGPWISNISDRLIDAFPSGEFDLIEAFARPLSGQVIARFLGVPVDMAPRLRGWSRDMVAMYQASRDREIERKAAHAARDFDTYLRDEIDRRRKSPGGGFLDDLVALEERGGNMSVDALVSTVVHLFNAGHEATVHALGNAVALLADRPERGTALEPPNMADTVEECLRYDPPLHLFTRHVYKPVEIMGHRLAPGQKVGGLLGSACRDDSVWPDGDKFDPFRARRAHLGFGTGIHACLGASLARLEMQIALPALFSRCPDLSVARQPKVANLSHIHGYERLPVEVRQAGPTST